MIERKEESVENEGMEGSKKGRMERAATQQKKTVVDQGKGCEPVPGRINEIFPQINLLETVLEGVIGKTLQEERNDESR